MCIAYPLYRHYHAHNHHHHDQVTPFRFTQYERVQYLDGDVLPTKNMDCYFMLNENTFNTGTASPLNSGWFLAIPNEQDFVEMRELAFDRLVRPWNTSRGWGIPLTPHVHLHYRGGDKDVVEWNFNGASLDQGLFTHYFVLNRLSGSTLSDQWTKKSASRGAMLIDTDKAWVFPLRGHGPSAEHAAHAHYDGEGGDGRASSSSSHDGLGQYWLPVSQALTSCGGVSPMQSFAHFTGRRKPWLQAGPLTASRDRQVALWGELLDSLHLSQYNSSSLQSAQLVPPLGYFAANK